MWMLPLAVLVILQVAAAATENMKAATGLGSVAIAGSPVVVSAGNLMGDGVDSKLLDAFPSKASQLETNVGQAKLLMDTSVPSAKNLVDQTLSSLVDHASPEVVVDPLDLGNGPKVNGTALPHGLGRDMDGAVAHDTPANPQPVMNLSEGLLQKAVTFSTPTLESSLGGPLQALPDFGSLWRSDHPRIVMDRSGDFFATSGEFSNTSARDANGLPYSTLQLGQQQDQQAVARIMQALQARASRGTELSQQEHQQVAQSLNSALFFKWLFGSGDDENTEKSKVEKAEEKGEEKKKGADEEEADENGIDVEEEFSGEEEESSNDEGSNNQEGDPDNPDRSNDEEKKKEGTSETLEAYKADAEEKAKEIDELAQSDLWHWEQYQPYGVGMNRQPLMPPPGIRGLPPSRQAGVRKACEEAAEKHSSDSKWEHLHEKCQELDEKHLLVLKYRSELADETLRGFKLFRQHNDLIERLQKARTLSTEGRKKINDEELSPNQEPDQRSQKSSAEASSPDQEPDPDQKTIQNSNVEPSQEDDQRTLQNSNDEPSQKE